MYVFIPVGSHWSRLVPRISLNAQPENDRPSGPPTPTSREISTWKVTNSTIEESATYSSNPNVSPKSQHCRGAVPGSNLEVATMRTGPPLLRHDHPTTSASNGLSVGNSLFNSAFRHSVSLLSSCHRAAHRLSISHRTRGFRGREAR